MVRRRLVYCFASPLEITRGRSGLTISYHESIALLQYIPCHWISAVKLPHCARYASRVCQMSFSLAFKQILNDIVGFFRSFLISEVFGTCDLYGVS